MAAALPTQNTSESERPDALRFNLLMKAIQRGDVAEVQVVLSGDVDVNATTPHGTTPLMSAAAFGHLEIVRALLKRGAALNQKRSDGFTALALAAFFGEQPTIAIPPRAFPAPAPTISNSPAEFSSVGTDKENPDAITLVRPRPSPV